MAPRILPIYGRVGHLPVAQERQVRRPATFVYLLLLVFVGLVAARRGEAQTPDDGGRPPNTANSGHWWELFASGFASSILAHEGAHIVAAYAVGGRPSFGFNMARPTIYSGIDAALEPRKQFIFSSAGLTVQSVIDEGILDTPHRSVRAGAFERGVLAGGIATSFFYVTVGRTGTVSDVDYMARTSKLNKTTITAIFGGLALVQSWRITRDSRYANFFARPDPYGGMRVGMAVEP